MTAATNQHNDVSPARIQRSRQRGWRMPPGAVYVGRPTRWGNPWRVGHPVTHRCAERTCRSRMSAADAVACYEADLRVGHLRFSVDDVRRELAGRDLACWCRLDQPCHADLLIELANSDDPSLGDPAGPAG